MAAKCWIVLALIVAGCASPGRPATALDEEMAPADGPGRIVAVHHSADRRIDVDISCSRTDWIRPGMSVQVSRDREPVGLAVVWEVGETSVRAVYVSPGMGAAYEPRANDSCCFIGAVSTLPDAALVLEILEHDRIVLSLGQRDGVRVGHEFKIARGATFVGFARVAEVSADRSIARIDTLNPGSGAPPQVKDRCYLR